MRNKQVPKGLSRHQERNVLKAAAESLLDGGHGVQSRECPDNATLKSLAHRDRPLAESADVVDHVATCPECFVKYSRYRGAYKTRVRAAYTAASLIVLAGVAITLSRFTGQPASAPDAAQEGAAQHKVPVQRAMQVMVDLRFVTRPRGAVEEPSASVTAIRLPRNLLSLSIQLPLGSDEGDYQLTLTDSAGSPVITTSGQARLQGYIAILSVAADLTNVPRGPYRLQIRRAQTERLSHPVQIE